MASNDLLEEQNQLAQRILLENPKKTDLEQFNHLSALSDTTSQYIQSNLESGFQGSQKQSSLNSSKNMKIKNNRTIGSLLNSDISNYTLSDDELENEDMSKKDKVNAIEEEEQDIDSDKEIFQIPPNIESLEKPLTYDELNRKCKNLEAEVKKAKQIYEVLLDQTYNDKSKIKTFEAQEKHYNDLISQNATKISSLEEQLSSLQQELQEKNNQQELIIQKQKDKINQIQFKLEQQTQQYNQQIQQFKEQLTQYQNQFSTQEKERQKTNGQKGDLVQNELLKIKDQIIQFLENELAEVMVSCQQPKTKLLSQLKINTNPSEQELKNYSINQNKQKLKNQDQFLSKPPSAKKQLATQDQQKFLTKLFNSQHRQSNSWIAQLNEKNKNMLKSYASSQKNNQSLSNLNCSIIESVDQDCQINDNQLIFNENA
ncbi:unnamed protein product [Paramecium octaurelia]|uniref:Uncharacterized protein n=1 Tax=Paramecium octaurelia TaxID=43137 RepID=A0A8S1VPA6_PAROT|nr:unnamed protein product [Paramecium octaurelia]